MTRQFVEKAVNVRQGDPTVACRALGTAQPQSMPNKNCKLTLPLPLNSATLLTSSPKLAPCPTFPSSSHAFKISSCAPLRVITLVIAPANDFSFI